MIFAIEKMDNTVTAFVQSNMHTPLLDKLMELFSLIGNNGVVWIVIALLLICFHKYRTAGLTILGALVLCVLIGDIALKPLIARMRPFAAQPGVSLLIPRPTDFSFPSGHTMSSFAAATVLFSANKRWGICGFALASLIAFSRLYLFVHYPSDIIGGMMIGVLVALVSLKIAEFFKKYSRV